jgi:mono/diheme cytochrome c family protein
MFSMLMLLSCAKLSSFEAEKASVPVPVPEIAENASAEEKHGAILYRVSGCVGCHSPPFPNAEHLGGDRDLPTIFGRFYAPNISPDIENGIGSWTEEDFFRAMRTGISPKGKRYWPTFPYMAYTKMSDEDIHALWVYLKSQSPSKKVPRTHEINPNYKLPGLLRIWRGMEFRAGEFHPDSERTEQENRGAYLVQAVSYCDQCHTPRDRLGKLVRKYYMAGGSNLGKEEVHPNLTPHMTKGLGRWSALDIVRFLETGTKPDGSQADHNQIMEEKIEDSYRFFSRVDKEAIAAYLKSLSPIDFDPSTFNP